MQTLTRTSDVLSATFSASVEVTKLKIQLSILLQKAAKSPPNSWRVSDVLTSLTSSKVEIVAFQSQLLHFSLLLLQFLLLVLHFLGLHHMIATYSRPIDAKYVAILVFSFCFATFFAFFYSLLN